MRYAIIMAGGSGTRLWPMSRASMPKQLLPFIGGESLLQIARQRLEGLIESDRVYICAGQAIRPQVLKALPDFAPDLYLSEPEGRDTLNAVAFASAVIGRNDPQAVVAIFTADHIIEPVETFQAVVRAGYELAEQQPTTLVTFGIAPLYAATAYGYLELADTIAGQARKVAQFKEKPDAVTARQYLNAGPRQYLWNSGMFVWRAQTLLNCVERYEPGNFEGIMSIARAWDTPRRDEVLARVYPTLKKISVDYAVMEPAAKDPSVQVAALPMPLTWLDVGSWPAFAQTCPMDDRNNAVAAARHVILDSANTLVASSDPHHLIAAVGCENLLIVHTPDATLVCRADKAEDIKKVHQQVGERFGPQLLSPLRPLRPTETLMRYLAIDFGQRRTGLAVGDDRTAIATPLAVLEESNPQRLLALIAQAAQEQEAAALVVGLPLNMDDSAGPAAQAARKLAAQLGRQTKLPIHLVDERLTSFAAEELLRGQDLTHGKKKARRDALAAATILQQFWQQKNQP